MIALAASEGTEFVALHPYQASTLCLFCIHISDFAAVGINGFQRGGTIDQVEMIWGCFARQAIGEPAY
tara:strand:- start:474 stop:677 length:204 start_codon:yes stop_codon:yes gene_type:complete